nr:GTPase [Synechococcus elongatus PCC 11802]
MRLKKTAKFLGKLWENFQEEISRHLPESYQKEINELTDKLETALTELIFELNNPVLTLATTGTTSSGKSTLVNFLCGDEIVPVAVSEMSAGTVTIEYSEKKSLIIAQTPGALWECGVWENITNEEIYIRLDKTMKSYLDSRESNLNIACPQSIIKYPFSLVKESKLTLPRGTKVKILDLPGLAHVGDEGNASIIRQCRDALCLVTYNSAETDKNRINNLLREVVEQVKDLGGSPARMLFILNRIDVFRSDRSWPDSENRFVESTTLSIKNELQDRLKEYRKDIDKIEVIKLSSWPALLGLQIRNGSPEVQLEACKRADNNFNGLIENILEDLPRNVQKWSSFERERVTEELLNNSYAKVFYRRLQEHIDSNFPYLVIPQIISKFNKLAGYAISEWSRQTTTAILNSSEQEYQKECENIELIRNSIHEFLEVSADELQKPFRKAEQGLKKSLTVDNESETGRDAIYYLESAITDLRTSITYSSLQDETAPLIEWRREIGKAIDTILEGVAESLETGRIELDNPYLTRVNYLQVNLLGKTLSKLIELGYAQEKAKVGWDFIATSESEKKKLKDINETLNELAIHLNIVIKETLQKVISQEEKRIATALEALFAKHLEIIQTGANEIAPNLSIKFPASDFTSFSLQSIDFLDIDIDFQAGFVITQKVWNEEVDVYVEKRVWWNFLWLIPTTVKETIYTTRNGDNAQIPKVETLLSGWIYQGKDVQLKILQKVVPWILEMINDLQDKINKNQTEVIDRYQSRLDKARDEIATDFERKQYLWQPLYEKSIDLSNELEQLENVLKLTRE